MDDSSVHDYLLIAWRRRLAIVLILVVVCGAALARALTQDASYLANAEVLLAQNDRTAILSGADVVVPQEEPERFAVTQARLARTRTVAIATVEAAGVSLTPAALLASSTVSAAPDSDFLRFSVTDGSAERAVLLATEFARQFSLYRARLDRAAVTRGLKHVRSQLQLLRSSGQTSTSLYSQLLTSEQRLATVQAVQSPRAILADASSRAAKVQPRPIRDVAIAAAIGVLLALGVAFLLEALDTRLRSADELAARINLPLLGRTLPIPRQTGTAKWLPTVHDPSGVHAEAYRMVRLNVEFANLEPAARLIMVTSALSGEGKSVTSANLAVSFARAGRNVLLIDLDLRRPRLHELFNVTSKPGVTDVTFGLTRPEDAMLQGVLRGGNALKPARQSGERVQEGSLALLPAGAPLTDPGSFVDTSALSQVLDEFRRRFDIVLIDTPPLLSVGDSLALGGLVEAVLVVSRSGSLRKSEARELSSVLETVPALKLGLVVTGIDARPAYSHYYERQDAVAELPVPLTATRWSRPAEGEA